MTMPTNQHDTGAETALAPILAAVDNALRNGSYMTGANLAFQMLCDRLGVDRDWLEFQPDWAAAARRLPAPTAEPLPGAVAVTPDEMIELLGGALEAAHRTRAQIETDRLQLAGALAEALRQRQTLVTLLNEVLRHFHEKGHPGERCLRTGWVREGDVRQWNDTLRSLPAIDTAALLRAREAGR